MIQFDYPSGGINRKERKKYTFSNFRGVDTSVAEINVAPSRAVESTNFVDIDGALHKRFGWEQIYQFDREINGFWELFLDGIKYTICYAGETFYELTNKGWEELYTSERLVSRRTACYMQGKKAYFIGCGDFLVFKYAHIVLPNKTIDGYTMFRVEDDDETYIPVTTAQISSLSSINDGVSVQYVRDSKNLLTGWRKNTLMGEEVPSNGVVEYQLDAPLNFLAEFEQETCVIIEEKKYHAYANAGEILNQEAIEEVNLIEGCCCFNRWKNDSLDVRDVNFFDGFTGDYNNEPLIEFDTGAKICWEEEKLPQGPYAAYSLCMFNDDGERISAHLRRCFALSGETEFENDPFKDARITIKDGASAFEIKLSVTNSRPYDRTYTIRVYFSNEVNYTYSIKLLKNNASVTSQKLYPADAQGASIEDDKTKIEKTTAGFSRVEERVLKDYYGDKYDLPDVYNSVTDDISSFMCVYLYSLTESTDIHIAKYKEGFGDIVHIYPNPTLKSAFYDKVSYSITQGGKITFDKLPIIGRSGVADIEVKFYDAGHKPETADLVTKVKYSTLYGVDGAADRLFVANNGEGAYANLIIFSELDDFSYFPDNFTKTVGGTTNEIKSFLRLADGSMAALKTFSPSEPTVFVFKGDYISGYYDAKSTEPYTLPRFSTIGAGITQACISAYASSNLADDSLFLSKDGVYALELSKGTDSQRFAKERSLPINKLLRECNLSDLESSVAITYKNKYYLAVKHYKKTTDAYVVENKTYYEKKQGEYVVVDTPTNNLGMSQYYEKENCVYIADAKYLFTPMGAMSDSPSYEWYPVNNIPVLNWFIINNELFFGTEDGRVCRFESDGYVDISKRFFATNPEDASIKKYSQATVHSISVNSPGFDNDFDDDGLIDTFSISEDLDVSDGDTIIFLGGEIRGNIYNDEEVDFVGKEFIIKRLIIDGVFKGIQLTCENHGPIVQCTNVSKLFAEVRKRSVVKAKRVLPTFDFGMPDYLKTLEGFTIVMNGVDGGTMSMEIETRLTGKEDENVNGQTSFNLLNGFVKNSFNVSFQNSYSKTVCIRNFNYMSTKISNEIETDCSISSISFVYKYNTRGRGVM